MKVYLLYLLMLAELVAGLICISISGRVNSFGTALALTAILIDMALMASESMRNNRRPDRFAI